MRHLIVMHAIALVNLERQSSNPHQWTSGVGVWFSNVAQKYCHYFQHVAGIF